MTAATTVVPIIDIPLVDRKREGKDFFPPPIIPVAEYVPGCSNFAPQLAQNRESSLILASQTIHCFMALEDVVKLLPHRGQESNVIGLSFPQYLQYIDLEVVCRFGNSSSVLFAWVSCRSDITFCFFPPCCTAPTIASMRPIIPNAPPRKMPPIAPAWKAPALEQD